MGGYTTGGSEPSNDIRIDKVVGGVVTIYVWDGTNWIAK